MEKNQEKNTPKKDKKIGSGKATPIEINPEIDTRINEAKAHNAVFTFGRMNPPTVGHEKLAMKVAQVARQKSAVPHIFLSHTSDPKKNPLAYKDKVKLAIKAFGKYPKGMVVDSPVRDVIAIMKMLEKMGHPSVTMVVGSDRVKEFETLLNKYNGKEYKFESIEVVSAGDRDPDAEGVSGMSASKMREAASANDIKLFKSGLASKLQSDAQRIMDMVRDGMNVNEEVNQEFDLLFEEIDEAVMTIQQRRKRALQMRRFKTKIARGRERAKKRMATPDKLKVRAQRHAIALVRRRFAGAKGADYKNLSPGEKIQIDKRIQKKQAIIQKLAKKLLPKERKAEVERLKQQRTGATKKEEYVVEKLSTPQDQDIDSRKGTQPARYHAGLSKSTKVARDAQFKKQAKMDDNDPKAYMPAPGDKTARTQPSKYTQRYHQMYDEADNSVVDRVKQRHQDELERIKVKQDREMDRARLTQTRVVNKTTTEQVSFADNKALFEAVDALNEFIAQENAYLLSEKSRTALKSKADKSGVSYAILKKVYDRGVAAWKTGHRPGTTPEQWGYARVNAFIAKKKDGNLNHDQDITKEEIAHELVREAGEASTKVKSTQTQRDGSNITKDVGANKKSTSIKINPEESELKEWNMALPDYPVQLDPKKDDGSWSLGDPPKPIPMDQIMGNEEKEISAADKKLEKERKVEAKKAKSGEMDTGTTSALNKYMKDTPGQWNEEVSPLDESFEGMFGSVWAKPAPTIQHIWDASDRRGLYADHSSVEEEKEESNCGCNPEPIEESEYQGKTVKLNNPFRTPGGPKKFSVYVKNDKGNIVKVNFGDPNMEIKRDDPDRRRSYRARHNCDNPGPKWKANYWSCYQWRASSKVDS
jgi:nicotinic acid mononucleotide adenylyltransferase